MNRTAMKRIILHTLFSTLLAALPAGAGEVVFSGMADASAASAIDSGKFIAADDEDNILRIYSREGGAPIAQRDVSDFLGVTGKKKPKEADLEAAAQIGPRTFWITSHGRSSKGKNTPERQRLFATEVQTKGGTIAIEPVGRPYSALLDDLIADPQYAAYRLADAALLAPKTPGALNIEGLTETPESHLLIGFRNPVSEGRALLARLLNPGEVIEGARARFGPPVELDLGGLGIRSITLSADRYRIIAGPIDGTGTSHLFDWDGKSAPKAIAGVSFEGLNPEGITFLQDEAASGYFVLSDDGSVLVDGVESKRLKDPAKKQFRGRLVKL